MRRFSRSFVPIFPLVREIRIRERNNSRVSRDSRSDNERTNTLCVYACVCANERGAYAAENSRLTCVDIWRCAH